MNFELSNKGTQLIKLYESMVVDGYNRTDGTSIVADDVFSDFESRTLRNDIKNLFDSYGVKTVLDYGCGGSDWNTSGFDIESNKSAKDFYNIDAIYRYEPARNIDERQPADAVLNFDVLEHIFISDVPSIIRDLFKNTKKLLIVNVACYKAAATLPDGTNAHITVRNQMWWKGMFDAISPEFPNVKVMLICSPAWRKFEGFKVFSDFGRQNQEGFVAID